MYSTAHYFAFTIAATVFASQKRRFIFRNNTVSRWIGSIRWRWWERVCFATLKRRSTVFDVGGMKSTPSNIFFAPRRFFLVAKTLSAKPCGRPCLVSGVVIAGTVSNGCNISSWSFVSSSTAPDRATTHARSKSTYLRRQQDTFSQRNASRWAHQRYRAHREALRCRLEASWWPTGSRQAGSKKVAADLLGREGVGESHGEIKNDRRAPQVRVLSDRC